MPAGIQSWRIFLSNEFKGIWAADLLVVHTINYRILYVFFFISHDRRKLIHFNVSASPTAAWIWHQLLEATPWGRQPAYLIHDRDALYGRDFDARAGRLGIAGVRTPPRAPKANSIAERLVETIRRECLDHIIVVNEGHLRRVLAEFMHYYNHDRPHRTLSLQSPCRRRVQGTVSLSPRRCSAACTMPTRVLPELGWPFAAPHLLNQPSFASAARSLGARIRAMPGAPGAAELLESLAAGRS